MADLLPRTQPLPSPKIRPTGILPGETMEEFDPGLWESIENFDREWRAKNLMPSPQAPPPPGLPERGQLGDIVAGGMRGLLVSGEQVAGVASTLGRFTGIKPLEEFGKGMIQGVEYGRTLPMFQPSQAEAAGGPRAWLGQIVEAAIPSFFAVAPMWATGGTAAGGLLPMLRAPLGTLAKSVGMKVAGLVPLTLFGAGEYDQYVRTANKQGMSEKEVMPQAALSGIVQGMGEWLTDVAGIKLLGLGKPLANILNGSIQKWLFPAILKVAPQVGKTMLVETLGESSQNFASALLREKSGIPTDAPLEAAINSIIPSIGVTLLFAGAIRGVSRGQSKFVLRALKEPDTKIEDRQTAARFISQNLKENNPDLAQEWDSISKDLITNGKPVPVDEDLSGYILNYWSKEFDLKTGKWKTREAGIPPSGEPERQPLILTTPEAEANIPPPLELTPGPLAEPTGQIGMELPERKAEGIGQGVLPIVLSTTGAKANVKAVAPVEPPPAAPVTVPLEPEVVGLITPVRVGDAQTIMGTDVVVAKTKTVDGIVYDLFNAGKLKDNRGFIRVSDPESGHVVSVTEYPTYGAAEAKYLKDTGAAEHIEKPSDIPGRYHPYLNDLIGEVKEGVAGGNIFTEAGEFVRRAKSTYPEWMRDRGWTGKEVVRALEKATAGEKLAKKQATIVDAALEEVK